MLKCLVDLDDLDRLIKLDKHWMGHYNKKSKLGKYYARTNISYRDEHGKYKQSTLYLSQFLLQYKGSNKYIDHHNHNSLDNRKENLFITEQTNNSTNRSGANKNNNTGVRNVSYMKKDNVYWVQIMKKGERFRWIFPVDQFQEACKFAKKKRKELFGEFAGKG